MGNAGKERGVRSRAWSMAVATLHGTKPYAALTVALAAAGGDNSAKQWREQGRVS